MSSGRSPSCTNVRFSFFFPSFPSSALFSLIRPLTRSGYVSSFADSNGDGIGDLPGLLSRLDHIQALGTDVLWLNPVFRSPHVDMGYDIADYRSVDARYGSNQDLVRFFLLSL